MVYATCTWHWYLALYGIGIWHCTALVFDTVRHFYLALYGIGIWHCYLALYGIGIWHCTALLFGTVWLCYLALYGTGIWHWYLTAITYIKIIVLLLPSSFVYNLFNLISINQAEWSTISTHPSFICPLETREML